MALPTPAFDYRNFRLRRINEEQYKHLWYLLFWPCLGLRYVLIERFIIPQQYFEVHCALDDVIPFCEYFLIPYVMWYILIVGVHLYTMLYDVEAFKRYSKYLIVAFSFSTLTFLLIPTCQNLRPEVFPRDNFLTDVVKLLYTIDTNTNVCPSEHVIGSVAAFLAVCHTKSLRKPKVIGVFALVAFFTSIATVFLKQHSAVDVIAALPVCAAAYLLCYGKRNRNMKKEKRILCETIV